MVGPWLPAASILSQKMQSFIAMSVLVMCTRRKKREVHQSLMWSTCKVYPTEYAYDVAVVCIAVIVLSVSSDSCDLFIHILQICVTGPCLTTAIWRCLKSFSQWQRSFQRKLRSLWLNVLWQRYVVVGRQGHEIGAIVRLPRACEVALKKMTDMTAPLRAISMPVEQL